jgi:hypothetical protein
MLTMMFVFAIAALWLFGSLIGAIFKLVFGIVGGVFALVGGLLGMVFGGIALLVIGPLVALALLPVFTPVLLLALVIWLIVRANRQPAVTTAPAPTAR